jgi:DinB family protein
MIIETPEAYTARLLSLVGKDDAFRILATTPGRLLELIAGRTSEELAHRRAPGTWSVLQILAHLADAEIVGGWRFRSVLAADGAPLQAFDQDTWAEAFRYEETDAFHSWRLFEANRAALVALLGRVDRSRYAHFGMHEERGRESIEHLIRLYAGHDRNHLAQIERLLGGTKEAGPR